MTDGTPYGHDDAVDAALASLTAVGRREQLLNPDTVTTLARAASAERGGQPMAVGTQLVDIEAIAPTGPLALTPRPSRRRSVLALAAALLVSAGVGVGVLSVASQQVVTEDGPAAGPDASGPADSRDQAAERPVLDLGDVSTTIVDLETDAIEADEAADPAESAGSPAVSETSPDPAPTSTTAPNAAPTSVSAAPPPSASAPTDQAIGGEWLMIAVGRAATVELRLDDSRPDVGTVQVAEGWNDRATVPRPGAFGLEFTDGASVAALEVWSEPGWFRLGVDHGGSWPSSTEWTRTLTIDGAGTVGVTYGDHGLSGLEIQVAGDWQHRVDSLGPDHLLVTLRSSSSLIGQDIRIDAGRTIVDVRIAGS